MQIACKSYKIWKSIYIYIYRLMSDRLSPVPDRFQTPLAEHAKKRQNTSENGAASLKLCTKYAQKTQVFVSTRTSKRTPCIRPPCSPRIAAWVGWKKIRRGWVFKYLESSPWWLQDFKHIVLEIQFQLQILSAARAVRLGVACVASLPGTSPCGKRSLSLFILCIS